MTAEERYAKNENIAYAVLRKIVPSYKGNEDYFQIAKLGLWKACLSYDESNGSTFSTYAYVVIRNEIYRQGLKCLKESKIGEIVSLDDAISDEINDFTLHDVVADTSNPTMYDEVEKEEILSPLNERERQIIELRLLGKTYKEIGQILGVSRQRINTISSEAMDRIILNNKLGKKLTNRECKKYLRQLKSQ